MKKDFSQHFEIIRNKFIEGQKGKSISMIALARFLNHAHDGKVNAWRKGQWPSADDIVVIHDKLGFSYRWLLNGEGEPLENQDTSGVERERMARLEARLEALENEKVEADRLIRQLTAKLLAQ